MIPVTPNIRRGGVNHQRGAIHISPVVLPNVNQNQIPPSPLMSLNLQPPYQQLPLRPPVPPMWHIPGQLGHGQIGNRNMENLQRYLQCVGGVNRGREVSYVMSYCRCGYSRGSSPLETQADSQFGGQSQKMSTSL